jgi:hypothetical protein
VLVEGESRAYTKLQGYIQNIPDWRHRSRTRLQIKACENCPRPPSYVQLGTLTH